MKLVFWLLSLLFSVVTTLIGVVLLIVYLAVTALVGAVVFLIGFFAKAAVFGG